MGVGDGLERTGLGEASSPRTPPGPETPLIPDGVAVRDLTLKTATLEAVFLQLTGKELRE